MPPSTELMAGHVITQEMTPVEKMIPLEASIESAAVSEERLPKQETEIKQEKHDLRKTTQRRRTSAQLSQLLKQVKRNEFEINQMRKSIESLESCRQGISKKQLAVNEATSITTCSIEESSDANPEGPSKNKNKSFIKY